MSFSKQVIWKDFTPVSGATIVIPVVDSNTSIFVRLNHTTTLASLTLQFPITGVPDGQIVKVFSKMPILTLNANVETGGTLLGGLSGLLSAGSANTIYQFAADTQTWYKLGT